MRATGQQHINADDNGKIEADGVCEIGGDDDDEYGDDENADDDDRDNPLSKGSNERVN